MRLWLPVLILAGSYPCLCQEKGEYHACTDKKGKTISAKIISVDESRRMAEIEREDGRTFSIEITTFSLEDQRYVREWLGLSSFARATESESGGKGRLRVFGTLRKGAAIGTDAAGAYDDIVAIEGSIFHFLVLTISGEIYEWTSGDPSQAIKPKVELSGPATAIRANGSTRAVRLVDRSWVAWGQSGASGILEKINSLGPVADIAFFSEPMKGSDAYVVWIEP